MNEQAEIDRLRAMGLELLEDWREWCKDAWISRLYSDNLNQGDRRRRIEDVCKNIEATYQSRKKEWEKDGRGATVD